MVCLRLIKNIDRNIRAAELWFLLGILLSAAFRRYVPAEVVSGLLGKMRIRRTDVATIGVPLYACNDGMIPLFIQWLAGGMGMGGAAAFMIFYKL